MGAQGAAGVVEMGLHRSRGDTEIGGHLGDPVAAEVVQADHQSLLGGQRPDGSEQIQVQGVEVIDHDGANPGQQLGASPGVAASVERFVDRCSADPPHGIVQSRDLPPPTIGSDERLLHRVGGGLVSVDDREASHQAGKLRPVHLLDGPADQRLVVHVLHDTPDTRQVPGWLGRTFRFAPGKVQVIPRKLPGTGARLVGVTGERLLLVDDEDNLRSMLEAALRHSGFEVHPAANGRDALAAVPEVKPDLIVLDVMLPDLDGFDVCQRLRSTGDRTPVLFLTARDATEDKVRGLTMGGDDYLVKPFSLDELVARINAVLRRTGNAKDGAVLTCLDLELDDEAHLVTRGGVEAALSPTEYNLLRYLLLNQGRVLSKAQILDHVWQYDFGGDGGVVETYIGYLRKKVDHVDPRLIQTVRGVGYTIRDPRN